MANANKDGQSMLSSEPKRYPMLIENARESSGYYSRTLGGSCTFVHGCDVCGRKLNEDKAVWIMVDHECGVAVDYAENADPNKYSCYPVGSDCFRKYLKPAGIIPVPKREN